MAVPVLWAAIIFFVYSIPGDDLVYIDLWAFFRFDKFVHIAVFAIWVVTLSVAFIKQRTNRQLKNNARTIAFFLAVAYGGFLEYFQAKLFVERSSDMMDFFANLIGAFAGLLLFRLIYGRCGNY